MAVTGPVGGAITAIALIWLVRKPDQLGVCFMNDAGYNPQDMVGMMQVLQSLETSNQPPEFLSTHPRPANRIQAIQTDIQQMDQCPK